MNNNAKIVLAHFPAAKVTTNDVGQNTPMWYLMSDGGDCPAHILAVSTVSSHDAWERAAIRIAKGYVPLPEKTPMQIDTSWNAIEQYTVCDADGTLLRPGLKTYESALGVATSYAEKDPETTYRIFAALAKVRAPKPAAVVEEFFKRNHG